MKKLVCTCDRCKKVVDFTHDLRVIRDTSLGEIPLRKFDLCDECMKDFNNFMNASPCEETRRV